MSNKKQTAVEWLESQLFFLGNMILNQREILNQSKEMEKQQKDDYAIEFAEWLEINAYKEGDLYKMYSVKYTLYNTKELLEIFKKEKGL